MMYWIQIYCFLAIFSFLSFRKCSCVSSIQPSWSYDFLSVVSPGKAHFLDPYSAFWRVPKAWRSSGFDRLHAEKEEAAPGREQRQGQERIYALRQAPCAELPLTSFCWVWGGTIKIQKGWSKRIRRYMYEKQNLEFQSWMELGRVFVVVLNSGNIN